jgi:hypothetical protein
MSCHAPGDTVSTVPEKYVPANDDHWLMMSLLSTHSLHNKVGQQDQDAQEIAQKDGEKSHLARSLLPLMPA